MRSKALPTVVLVTAGALAIVMAARWTSRTAAPYPRRDRGWQNDGLPAVHPPFRVVVVSPLDEAEAGAPKDSRVRPWPRVLADIAAHNAGPRPVIVAPVAPQRFPAWREPAELVVTGPAPARDAIVTHARTLGAEVLAVGPGCPVEGAVACLDGAPKAPLTREGHQRLALLVAEWLRGQGRLESAHLYADWIDLAEAEDDRAELAGGFSGAEDYPAGLGGRWTREEATLQLERRGHEGGLVVALSLRHPLLRSAGRVEVGGRAMRAVSGPNGRWNLYLDVRDVPGRVLPVRIVADEPYVPRDLGPTEDARTLGLLVHAAWLTERPVEAEVDLGVAEDGRLELASGFWKRERFPDGRVGRWSRKEAALLLERQGQERGLALDVSLEHPEGVTSGRVEVGGRVVPFRWENGSRREVFDVGGGPGRQVPVRIVVDTAFQANAVHDTRVLGLFVHGVRLVDDPAAVRAAWVAEAAQASGEGADWPGVTRDLQVAAAGDEGPELLSGFGPGEDWPDGRSGRWTFRHAVFRLERTAGETELVLDLSCQSPWNLTTGWIEVGGVRRHRFRSTNGGQRLVLDVADIPGTQLEVAIMVDRPFRRPGQGPAGREYGLFLHRVRLARP